MTDKMNELLYQEEMIWLQRSRIAWLKEGDRNTKFFQNKAVWRAQKNKIRQLTDSVGVVHSEFAAMSEIANNYFHEIFTADTTLDATPVLDLLEQTVTEEDNAKLCAVFSDKEISDAMFQIGPLKAPGPDGFPTRFFQQNWSTVRVDVIAAVKDFFVSGISKKNVNSCTGCKTFSFCTESSQPSSKPSQRLYLAQTLIKR